MPITLTKPTARELATNHFVYSEAMHHRDLQLRRGDIAEGIKAFRELTGQDAKLVTLHPGNEPLANAIPEGIAVSYCGGCLKWQVWLATGEIKPAKNGDNGRHNLYQNSAILPLPTNDAPTILVQAPPVEEIPKKPIRRPSPQKKAVPPKSRKQSRNTLYQNPAPSNDTPLPLQLPPCGKEAPQKAIKGTTRGRHPKVFPEDTIRELRKSMTIRGKPMTIRKIWAELDHQGIKISLMSISRILSGQRSLTIGN